MFVYRVMSSTEIINRIKGININDTLHKGINTFEYKDGIDYIHFYKFAQHAFINSHLFGPVVAKIELNDDIIPPLEYGIYANIRTDYDDSLSSNNFPMPEIIIDRSLFSNDNIALFSNTLTESFLENENGSYPFFVNRKNIFGIEQIQKWNIHDVYYEYVKSLFPLFDNLGISVSLYLKTIDLDKELVKFAEEIKNKKLIIKKKIRYKM